MNHRIETSVETKQVDAPRGTCERASGPVIRVTAYLPPPLARSLRVRAAEQGRTVSAVVADALVNAEVEAT